METAPLRCPYVGLQPFTEGQKTLFFGRDREVRLVGANALASKLTVVYGASGVGKSSLLMAGVLPDLRGRPGTAVVLFRDWQHADAPALLKAAVRGAADLAAGRALALDAALPLDDLLAQVSAALRGTTVLLLDQFEEYFRYHPPGGAADAFDAEFARAVNRRDVDAGFVVAIREDSLSQLDRYRARIPAILANPLRIRHLGASAARDAIVRPLQACRGEPGTAGLPLEQDPEEGLVDALIAQTRTGSVSLGRAGGGRAAGDDEELRVEAPYLQLVLARLWEAECAHKSTRLREKTLADLGGAATIVRTHLDQVMARFAPADRRLCAALFDRMVTPSGAKIACRIDDLRRWAPEATGANVDRVVAELVGPGARILRAIDPRPGEPPQFEIFHDVLALGVIDWCAREAALVERDRQARLATRRRRQLLLAAGVTLASLALGGFSLVQWRLAKEQEREALAGFYASRSLIGSADPVSALDFAVKGVERSAAERVTVALRLAVARQRLRLRVDMPEGRSIVQAAPAEDGSAIALRLDDGSVEFRALPSLALERRLAPATLPADASERHRLFYRRSPQRLLAAADTGVLRWDAEGLATSPLPRGSEQRIFDALGRVALSIDGADRVSAFDPASGQAVPLRGCGGRPLAVSAEPSLLTAEIARGGPAALQLCDARAGRVLRLLPLDSGSPSGRGAGFAQAARFSPDGQWLAVRHLEAEEVLVWQTATGRRTTLRDFTAAPNEPHFVGGDMLVVPVYDGRLDLWRLSSLERRAVSSGPARDERVVRLAGSLGTLFVGAVGPVGLAATGLVSVDTDGVSIWQGAAELSPPLAEGHVVAHAVSAADGSVNAVLRDGTVGRIADDGRFVAGAPAAAPATEVRPSPDGERVLVLDATGRVVAWNLRTAQRLGEVAADGAVAGVAWASRCCAFTVRRRDGQLTLYEWDRNGALGRRALAPQLRNGWLAPGGQLWVARDGSVASATGAPAPQRAEKASVPYADLAWPFAEDGRVFAQVDGFFPGLATLGGAARRLEGHSATITATDLSANGHFALTGSDDWHAIVWDTRAKLSPVRLSAHTQSLVSVAFTRPNTAFVATTARDATLRVWEPYSGEPIARAALPGPDWRVLDFRDGRVLVAGRDGGLRMLDCEPCWPADRLRGLAEGRLRAITAAAAAASAPR